MRNLEEALSRHEFLKRNYSVTFDDALFKKMTSERGDLPSYVKERIKRLVELIKDKYPHVEDIHLVGSYAKNTYVDENTPKEFRVAKARTGVIVKVSDFDFETTPLIIGFITTDDGLKIHLCKDRDGKKINVFDTEWQY